MQFVFAGKAHPADDSGKEMIRQIGAFAADPEVRHRFVFVDDYDIAVARTLLQGADVWLNNPRRPQEACGTSGMKAALNGGLNLSILDGWWDECSTARTAGPSRRPSTLDDLERRDEVEADSLFELLERQVVPLFYERWQGPVPAALGAAGQAQPRHPRPGRHRGPHGARLHRAALRAHRRPGRPARAPTATPPARELAGWKAEVDAAWPGVHVDHVETDDALADLGTERAVEAIVALGELGPDDVQVQLLHGPVGQGEELSAPERGGARGGRRRRRRPPPLPRPLHLRAGRPLRLHRPRRPHPPRPRDPGRARQGAPGR